MQALREKKMTLEETENGNEDKKERIKICRAKKSLEENPMKNK